MKPTRLEETLLRENFSDSEYPAALARMQAGEPLAYIIGKWYFYGLEFVLNKACLIPRPDTELVVEKAIKLLPPGARFADLCTGSGCIAVSVLANRPDCIATAVDISPDACRAALKNAKNNGVDSRLKIICSDIAEFESDGVFDAIISNPPYIPTAVLPTLSVQVGHEPALALDGGADGMDFYRLILSRFHPFVKRGGYFLFEIGYDEGEKIKSLSPCAIYKDFGGNDRLAVITV